MSNEVISGFIIFIFTVVNVFTWVKYLYNLHTDLNNNIFIYGDKLHSLQHFAIVGSLMLLSVVMCIESIWDISLPVQFLEHLFYNLACILIVYPHLISEK